MVRTDVSRSKLLAWFHRQKRQLPWRGTRDPYRIWVSEVMLQQTTAAAVRGRYPAFVSRFPDLTALARAREETVLAAWSGLGYYARARNLREAARVVLREHRGRLPRDPAVLRGLPGFGDYTAAAVACLAFGARVPAADANVTRVLSRLFAIRGSFLRGEVSERARELLASGRPQHVLAALMDLGQLVCTPRRPRCGRCPVAEYCVAARQGSPEAYPPRAAAPRRADVCLAVACVRRDGRAWLLRRSGRLLGGLWEFPCAEGKTPDAARRSLALKARRLGIRLTGSSPGRARHTVVNRRLSIEVFPARPSSQFSILNSQLPDSRWFTAAELARAAIPTLTRKVARAAGFL